MAVIRKDTKKVEGFLLSANQYIKNNFQSFHKLKCGLKKFNKKFFKLSKWLYAHVENIEDFYMVIYYLSEYTLKFSERIDSLFIDVFGDFPSEPSYL